MLKIKDSRVCSDRVWGRSVEQLTPIDETSIPLGALAPVCAPYRRLSVDTQDRDYRGMTMVNACIHYAGALAPRALLPALLPDEMRPREGHPTRNSSRFPPPVAFSTTVGFLLGCNCSCPPAVLPD